MAAARRARGEGEEEAAARREGAGSWRDPSLTAGPALSLRPRGTRNQCKQPGLGTGRSVLPTKADAVVTPPGFKEFYVRNTSRAVFLPALLAVQGTKALALSLMVDTFVLKLDLSDNWLQGEGAAAIAEMLKENGCVSAVDLSHKKLGIEGAKAFSAVFLENTTVVSLQLSGNEFDDHAAKRLADTITANRKTEILGLSDSMLGDKAGEMLGTAIAENIALKELKISWNHFHSQGAAALAKGLGVLLEKIHLPLP